MSKYSKLALENRTMSGFPVSIGTGLALETLFHPIMEVIDPDREVNRLADLNRYDDYMFNIRTLIRNIFSSVPSEVTDILEAKDVLETLKEEVGFIRDFFTQQGLKIKFYYNTLESFKTSYPDQIRKATTPKQMHEEQVTNYCTSKITEEDKTITTFNSYLRYGYKNSSLVLTNYAADLLSYPYFTVLDLLESHTGVIKTRKEYNTKYYPLPREDMSTLPLFEYLLSVFGDRTLFKPRPIKERLQVYKVCIDKRLNPYTSEYSFGVQFLKHKK